MVRTKDIKARPQAMGCKTRAAVNAFETMLVRSSSCLRCKIYVSSWSGCGRKASDVQSVCGGGIELIAKFGSGTGWFRLGACSKEADNERTWVRKRRWVICIYARRTYETSMAERQYPQTPNLTTALMPEFVRELSL